MKPNRPDSAKTTRTKITLDSEHTSKDLTASKFSETYSNGVRSNNDANPDFYKYVAEKDKDPRFKKYGNSSVPKNSLQTKPPSELSKYTSKPFERKSSKIEKEKTEKKIEEGSKIIEVPKKEVKKENFQSSQTFMEKNKQKFKLTSKQELDGKNDNVKILNGSQVSQASYVNEEEETKLIPKSKINLNGFVLNVPGKKPQVINEKKTENVQETEEERQIKERERVMTELSQYVQEIETRNENYLPSRYNEFVERNLKGSGVDLEKINIEDFCSEPNDMDYDRLMKKINENELRLGEGDRPNSRMQNSSLSINLEEIIDGGDTEFNEDEDKEEKLAESFVALSSMSVSDVKDRNTFLTEILKGRINSGQIEEIKKQDEARVKLIKLEGLDKEDELDEEEVEMVEINMNKKKHNRILERNKYEAAGELMRECDYLSAEQQKRIEDLLNGAEIESPFEFSEMQSFMNRRIDEGINLHRNLCRNVEGLNTEEENIEIDEETLPKDPILRKNAEFKILKEKINSINARLTGLNGVTISQPKVRSLINKLKENIKTSKMGEKLIEEKRKQFEEQGKQLSEAEKLLKKTEEQGGEILKLIEEMMSEYGSMEEEILRIQNMGIEERRQLEKEELKKKEKSVIEVEKLVQQLEEDELRIEQQIQNLDQIMSIQIPKPQCEGHSQSETIDDLDELVTKKWQEAEQAVENLRGSQGLLQ